MQIRSEPIDYRAEDIYLVSNTQNNLLEGCKLPWQQKYYFRMIGENIEHEPFSTGNYGHTMMENAMQIENKHARDTYVAEYINNRGALSMKKRSGFQNSIVHILKFLDRYHYPEDSSEIELAIKAPMDWFSDELPEALQNIKMGNGTIRSFGGIGFRGIIDYFGIDGNTNENVIVDWKTGKYRDKWGNLNKYISNYELQLLIYHYLCAVNSYNADIGRDEFINTGDTHQIHLDIKKSEDLIKSKLQQVATAIIDSYQGKKFEATPNKNCGTCYMQNLCPHPERQNTFVREYFTSAYFEVVE